MNGFSDLMVEVFGEAGRHARSAVGVAGLPGNSPVEVEMIVELVAWAGSAASGLIGGICPPAFVDRKASTPDALGETVAQTLKLGDHLIDAFRPCPRETRPDLARGAAISGKLGKFRPDF